MALTEERQDHIIFIFLWNTLCTKIPINTVI